MGSGGSIWQNGSYVGSMWAGDKEEKEMYGCAYNGPERSEVMVITTASSGGSSSNGSHGNQYQKDHIQMLRKSFPNNKH